MNQVMSAGLAAAVLLGSTAAWGAAAGQVSFLEGSASREADGHTSDLAMGGEVQEHDILATGSKSRLEVTLADKSVVRLGPDSKAEVLSATFNDEGRKLNFHLVLGSIWARVAGALGNENKFEVTTDHAVAGVRGTTFRVDSKQDKAVVVRVYAGAVAVAGNHFPLKGAEPSSPAKGQRKQIAGPKEVSKQEWEKLVGSQMQVKVAADGTPGEPERFAQADDCKESWSRWNHERDGEPCPH